MKNQKEIWKDIKGFEGYYQISNLSRIKRLYRVIETGYRTLKYKEVIFNPYLEKNGRYRISICLKNKKIKLNLSRTLYETFKGDLKEGFVIDHIDGNPLNNNLDNLQQITTRENTSKDTWKLNKTSKYVGVHWSKSHKRWRAQIHINKKMIWLGNYKKEEDAHQVYQNKLKEIKNI